MVDASYEAYNRHTQGYSHFSGGAFCSPGDYHGLVALLVRADAEPARNEQRLRDALNFLYQSDTPNPILRRVLTCYERELQRCPEDAFPPAAGSGGVPIMQWDPSDLHPGVDAEAAAGDAAGTATGVEVNGDGPRRLRAHPGICGALQTPYETRPNAVDRGNQLRNLTIGNCTCRESGTTELQPARGTTINSSLENLQHPSLHYLGAGGYYEKADGTSCDPHHHAKLRIFSVTDKFRRAPEYVWGKYQSQLKASLHNASARLVNPELAQTATREAATAQRAALLQANPEYAEHLAAEESFSGGVPKTIRGGKRYWREAFLQLMAMAAEYGTPQFFLTLTANEMGWRDLRTATRGAYHGDRPVEATRQYYRRWSSFKNIFLKKGPSEIGEITHLWYRHEDQSRGSLHIHMAIWVRPGTETPGVICGMAPRSCTTPEELEWRNFVLAVQRHDCRPKCRWKNGQYRGDNFCKTGYPRSLFDEYEVRQSPLRIKRDHSHTVCEHTWPQRAPMATLTASTLAALYPSYTSVHRTPMLADTHRHILCTLRQVSATGQRTARLLAHCTETDRYIYRTTHTEDQRLSTYVPVWLLAWGANMNIQYCTTAGFLNYISK